MKKLLISLLCILVIACIVSCDDTASKSVITPYTPIYVAPIYKVSFFNGDVPFAVQYVTACNFAAVPQSQPTSTNFTTFTGWTTNTNARIYNSYTNTSPYCPFAFSSTPITSDISLYAYGEAEEVFCVIAGTMVTMADGSQKKVEDVTFDDYLLSYDFFDGCLKSRKVLLIEKTLSVLNTVLTLTTDNGKQIKFVDMQGFFDADERVYFDITDDNYNSMVGRRILTLENDNLKESTIVSITSENKVVDCYDLVTEYDGNFFADEILNVVPDGIYTMFPFEIDDNYKVNESDMAKKIETYGLYDSSTFPFSISQYGFDVCRAKYFKILIDSGILSIEKLKQCIGYTKEHM